MRAINYLTFRNKIALQKINGINIYSNLMKKNWTNYNRKKRTKLHKRMNLLFMRGPLNNQGCCLANAYSNAIINSKAYNSIKKMEHSYRILLFKNNYLNNEMINSLTLFMEVFVYNVYRDEQVDPLVVDFSLNLVNP